VRAHVEPGNPTAEHFHMQAFALQVLFVHVGDFEFAARAWFEVFGNLQNIVVVKVEPRHSVVAFGLCGFFNNLNRTAVGVEGNNAITCWVVHMVAKHGGSLGAACGVGKAIGEAMTIEHVVAQNKAAVGVAYEWGADGEGLCQAIGAGLLGIAEVHAPLRAIAEQALEQREVVGCGDDQHVAHVCEHECAEWVVDHRFVVHGKDLLGDGFGERVQACA